MRNVESYAKGAWVPPGSGARDIRDAATGAVIARAGGAALDFAGMAQFARERGGAALREMTFHDRARMLKALALYLNERKEALYEVSYATGATKSDHLFDIDGGIGTLFVHASKGRREMPDARVMRDGGVERFGNEGRFLGQHIWTPLRGVAVHINAFNFPVWGMLEKLAPSLLAGVPAIVKPATASAQVTETCVRLILESGLLPEGALQLICGDTGDLLDHLGAQDVVGFTGSAATGHTLRSHPGLLANAVRFSAEQDSLNAAILGPDVTQGSPEFDLFIKEAVREMTVKAGQKCTAMRRLIVPEGQVDTVVFALSARLAKVTIGNPRREDVRMGPLISTAQRADVLAQAARIGAEAERVFGGQEGLSPIGADAEAGAFVAPTLYLCADPDSASAVHEVEAFGPVATLLPCRDMTHAAALANRGGGSLVASLFTNDTEVAREVAAETAPWHGRLYLMNREAAAEATGHGAPMPHMIHGGPGRAGGGEELGGIRGVKHYMQRSAIQGSAEMIRAVTGPWLPGAAQREGHEHPFRKSFGDLAPGDVLRTRPRVVTLEDIEHFAQFTGDTFYAHMDEAAAARNPFFPGRVAHGYLLLSFAAGLFVDPDEGPVLANTGLDNLRFLKPVPPGTAIRVELTVMDKTRRTPDYGEVRWHVRILDEESAPVAEYELLTMVAGKDGAA